MHNIVDVQWLTQSKMFKENIQLIAGSRGLGRRVTYVTVQEAPNLYEQIDGGEFILSAWFAFKDDPMSGIEAIRNLSLKASGLCIKINRFISAIPNEYIEFCNAVDFPLFIVDENIKFREIIRSVTIEINLAKTNIILDLNDYYSYLFNKALNNGNSDEILLDFSKRLGVIAISTSIDFRQIRGLRSLTKLPDYEHRLRTIKNIIRTNPVGLTNNKEYFSCDEYHVFPCIARGYCYGYVVILFKNKLTETQYLYTRQLVNVLTIKWLDKQEHANDMLHSMLDMIYNSPCEHEKKIKLFLKERNIDHQSGIRCLHIKINNITSGNRVELSVFQSFLLDMIAFKPNILYIWDKVNSFVVFLDNQEKEEEVCLKKLKFLAQKYTDILISIGPSVNQIHEIRYSAEIAARLYNIALHTNFIFYKDYLMYIAIIGGAKSFECKLFLEEIIMPIKRHDTQFQDYLLETLITVVRYENLELAAKVHHIHTNTVRYRLSKIKKILGIDYFTQKGRIILYIACILYYQGNLYFNDANM